MKIFLLVAMLLASMVLPVWADATFDEARALFDDGNYADALPIAQDFAGYLQKCGGTKRMRELRQIELNLGEPGA